jgi:hypothetical protein
MLTPETKESLLGQCDRLSQQLALVRGNLSVHRVGNAEGDAVGAALSKLTNVIRRTATEGPAPARRSQRFTAAMRPNYRGD